MIQWLRHPSIAMTLAVGLGVLAHAALARTGAARKLSDAGLEGGNASRNITVTLSVPPEQFHMSRLQQWGTMTGASGRTVNLRNVSPAALAQVARYMWVASVQASGS